jgi:excisionase family DNA binding protein
MQDQERFGQKKPPARATVPNSERLLVGRKEAADLLSISARALDYLVANRQLIVRRIGSRVLIPVSELQRFTRVDHPRRLAG